jgi:hypothetical protein
MDYIRLPRLFLKLAAHVRFARLLGTGSITWCEALLPTLSRTYGALL